MRCSGIEYLAKYPENNGNLRQEISYIDKYIILYGLSFHISQNIQYFQIAFLQCVNISFQYIDIPLQIHETFICIFAEIVKLGL